MTRYPLHFTFTENVVGKGFLAKVETGGRALLVDEGHGDWWVYGVQPGGLAESGEGWLAAYRTFRENFRTVLFDIASDAEDFVSFKRETESFCSAVCESAKADWEQAVLDRRAQPPSPTEPNLPKRPAADTYVEVEFLVLQPKVNVEHSAEEALAA